MVSFPNAKINLGLNITGKRADGYHDLETVFYPVNIKDAVEVIEQQNNSSEISFTSSGNTIAGNESDNLCVKAFYLLKKDFPQIPSVKIHLQKHIPSGAGLGGGSADASAVLILLNRKFDLGISDEKLKDYALSTGSDCPFFIINKPCFATGRGEILNEIAVDLSAYKIMIVHPGIHVSTAAAFAGLDANNFSSIGELRQHIQANIINWKGLIKNDFEDAVFKLHPQLADIKEQLYEAGAIYSAMSGSGSSVYGIFSPEQVVNIKFPAHWFCQTV